MKGVLSSHDLWKQTSLVLFKEWRVAAESATKGQQANLANPFIATVWKPFNLHFGSVLDDFSSYGEVFYSWLQ